MPDNAPRHATRRRNERFGGESKAPIVVAAASQQMGSARRRQIFLATETTRRYAATRLFARPLAGPESRQAARGRRRTAISSVPGRRAVEPNRPGKCEL